MNPNIGGTIQSSLSGGQDVRVNAMTGIGNEKVNGAAGVFASANTQGGPATVGAFAAANAHGHGLSVQHSITPGVGTTLSENARMNVMQGGPHSVDVNAFHSRTQLNNGLNFDKVGGNLAWNHAQGHAASVGMSQIPKFDMKTVDASVKANLWSSPSGASTFDAIGSAQKHLSGPFAGQKNFGAGVGFNHKF